MTGKTIRIYLVDGTPTGILTAEIINWTGKATVGPRSGLAEMAKHHRGQADRHLSAGRARPRERDPGPRVRRRGGQRPDAPDQARGR